MSEPKVSIDMKKKQSSGVFVTTFPNEGYIDDKEKNMSIECLIGFVFDQLAQNFQKFDLGFQEIKTKSFDSSPPFPGDQFNPLQAITSILEGKKADVNDFFGNLKFARVGGVPSSIVGVASSVKEEGEESVGNREETGGSSAQKLANGLLSIPFSNVERLRSTLSTVSLTELIELLPQLGRSSKDYPDKKKLISVQDFFRYTESEGMSLK